MKADLHTHSRCSDGSCSVEALVSLAAAKGVRLLSLTDHDTVAGTSRAMIAGDKAGIQVLSGIEISAFDPVSGGKVHILGYGYQMPAPALQALCRPLLERRHANTLRQIEAVAGAGYKISEEEVFEEAGESRMLYKQHLMAVLIRKGYTDSIYSDLYRRLFKGDGPAAGDIAYIPYRKAIEAVLDDGGIPVLAHPGQQGCFDLLPDLLKAGLAGIELNHPDNGLEDKNKIVAAAERYRLLLTGGSDFHGEYGSEAELGEVVAPDNFEEAWKERTKISRDFAGIKWK